MFDSLLVADQVQEVRRRIDRALARFDRAFYHSGGAALSPLDFRDEFDDFAAAALELENVLDGVDG